MNRRDILGVLGLSAAAVSTEALAFDEDVNGKGMPIGVPAYTKRGYDTIDKIATALENLAKSIRNREAIPTKLVTNSKMEGDEFLQHDVTVTVELPAQSLEVRISEEGRMAEENFRKAQQVLEDARVDAKRIRDQANYEVLMAQNENWRLRNSGPISLSEKV